MLSPKSKQFVQGTLRLFGKKCLSRPAKCLCVIDSRKSLLPKLPENNFRYELEIFFAKSKLFVPEYAIIAQICIH